MDRSASLPTRGRAQTGAFFWEAAAQGRLAIGWCPGCSLHVHPEAQVCPSCHQGGLDCAVVGGRGTVVGCTVNHQPWPGCPPPPYVVAIVSLDEASGVRLTTNIVDCPVDDVRVGLAVDVRFEQRGGHWLPVFAPLAEAFAEPDPEPLPTVNVRPPACAERFEDRVAITGIGASAIARRLDETSLSLELQASRAAIADAGLEPSDIDGLVSYPGSSGLPGLSSGGVRDLERALGLRPTWHNGAAETPGQTGGLVVAMLAVAAGLCRHVLCVTSVSSGARPVDQARTAAGDDAGIGGELAWRLPYGAPSPANWIALYASHYMSRFGMRRESLGWIAINARRNAALNEHALYRDPITMDDYLQARLISTPFGLYDCDVPCDGAGAVVISAKRTPDEGSRARVMVDAVGTQITERQSWDQGTITHQPNVFGPSAHLWSRTAMRPADVDAAQLYDGFTFNCLSWIEALGFCAIGEGADFVDGATRIARDGVLPLNTHGGQLCAGRLNGFGAVHEAVRQIRGDAGARQLDHVEVVVTSSGGGIPASCMLLTREP